MPLYEYHCHDCQNRFEVLVRSGSTVACPACGSPAAAKLLSTFAVTKEPSCPARGLPGPGCAGGNSPCAGGSCPFS